ncbi:hypothetical protein MidiMira_05 [Proteus phage MidiMira-UFV02]|nr:hypothetical protein BigMira_05 [Proteus phage BigMira-UFV01]WJJ57732.1 hypothetical protein MidiMira_05 [Proteus phage MidiMira-UFV02]
MDIILGSFELSISVNAIYAICTVTCVYIIFKAVIETFK